MDAVETIEHDGFTPEPESDDDIVAADDDPAHLAKCAECSAAVKFRPNVTGTGFFLVDADLDATFGIGEHGRPMCPDGHGEMEIADDQLKPAREAFADVAARQAAETPVQRSLPGVVPVFNFEGCYKELEEKAVEVDALHNEYQRRAEDARDAKKRWDGAAETYTKMALEFRRRRQGKVSADEPPAELSPRLVKCTWEAQHAGETCPLCDDERLSPFERHEIFGNTETLPPADAESHVDAVERAIAWIEMREAVEALESIDTFIPDGVVSEWTSEDRKAVTLYAEQQLALRNRTTDGVDRLERPKILGKPHIPAAAVRTADGEGYEPQVCSICGEVLQREYDTDAFQVTDFVGVDCSGKAPKAKGPDHHYPATGKKKAPAKGAKKTAAKART